MTGKRRWSWLIFIGLLAYFLGMFAVYGLGIYNDSDQYITMHIHREPLYPLYLACFRKIAGAESGLILAVIVQSVLTPISILALSEYLTSRFFLKLSGELVIVVLLILPHLMTKYMSALSIFLESSIMSEALCIPLFQFFILFMLKMLYEMKLRDAAFSLLFAFLLSMTRSQMSVALVIWVLGAMFVLLVRKQYKRLVLPLCALICVVGVRQLSVYTYNYFVTGYFMGNTYGQVNILTNVMYASDPEDREVFEDGSLEQMFFDSFYKEASARGVNYSYAGETIAERTAHLEDSHDILKFDIIEGGFSTYFWTLEEVEDDYYKQSSMSDEMAGTMFAKLLPACFGQWIYDYLLLCRYGFIRSIAVVNKFINWIALGIYLAAAGLFLYMCRKGWKNPAVWLMGLAFLVIVANVCAVSLTIMCLSRYMVYGFSLFYIALFILGREFLCKKTGNYLL